MSKEWFETWFNTDYYHLLYRNRNEVEARHFIDALLRFLDPKSGSTFVDVACGKGRHSRYLHSLGYDVTGIDLSKNSIEEARANAGDASSIRFIEHDIRKPFPVIDRDVAVNLFTSFGYFETDDEHRRAMENMHACLSNGGRLVIDYLNASEVVHNLKREDHCTVDGIDFKVTRKVKDGFITKYIEVTDGPNTHHFQERVRAFNRIDLEHLMTGAGFSIEEVFGNYRLEQHTEHSPRVVIIAQKKA